MTREEIENECTCDGNKYYYWCSNCRKAEDEIDKELAELRAWKARAMPFIEAECENIGECLAVREPFKEDGFMTPELHDAVTKDLEENHAILRELVKGEE